MKVPSPQKVPNNELSKWILMWNFAIFFSLLSTEFYFDLVKSYSWLFIFMLTILPANIVLNVILSFILDIFPAAAHAKC